MPKKRDESAPFWMQMREAERSIIAFAIKCGGTLRKAADLLGISPNYLSERVRDLGMEVPESKPGPKPGSRRVKPDRAVEGNGASEPVDPSEDAEDDDEGNEDPENENGTGEDFDEDEDEDGDEDDAEDGEDEDELEIEVGEANEDAAKG